MSNILNKTIVVVDDDEIIREVIEGYLDHEGFTNIVKCENGKKGLDFIKNNNVNLVFLDLNLPDINGSLVLENINHDHPEIPVIIITGNDDLDSAISIINNGAYDYLQKPFNLKKIITTAKNALHFYDLNSSFNSLKEELLISKPGKSKAFSSIITKNEKMINLFRYISSIATTSFPLLITGETGVGKELFARSVHEKSNLMGSFIAMDVSSYSSESFKDALFGHVKGAYTGAESKRSGLFKMAENGTLFLDEIGDLSLELQSLLLRVLQEQEYRQIGSDKVIKTYCRIIFATNRNLLELIEEGKFRKDLYYRLETHSFEVPPLRDRNDDIPLLFEHFVTTITNKSIDISDEIYSYISKYHFPGNVRELKNIAINAVSISKNNVITIMDVLCKLKILHEEKTLEETEVQPSNDFIFNEMISCSEFPTIEEVTRLLIEEALNRTNNNQSKAAKLLGISRQALNIRINKKN